MKFPHKIFRNWSALLKEPIFLSYKNFRFEAKLNVYVIRDSSIEPKKRKKTAVFSGKTCNWMCKNFSYIFLCNLGSTCERHDWVVASPIISLVKQYFCNNPDEPDWWDTYMFPCFYIVLYIYFLKRMKNFHTSNYRADLFSGIYLQLHL